MKGSSSVGKASTIHVFGSRRGRNSSRRKVLLAVLGLSPSTCCIAM